MATAVTGEQQFSRGNQQHQIVNSPPLMFGLFPYQGPLPPRPRSSGMPRRGTWNFRNPLQQPPAGDLGIAGGATIGAAAAATDAGEFDNAGGALMQSLNLGAAHDDELAEMMAMYTAVPKVGFAGNEAAAMAEMYYNNNSSGSHVAPQDPAMAGAFGGDATSFMAPQGPGAAPTGNQLAAGDDLEAMFASDQNEEAVTYPLEALLGLDVPMYDAGHRLIATSRRVAQLPPPPLMLQGPR